VISWNKTRIVSSICPSLTVALRTKASDVRTSERVLERAETNGEAGSSRSSVKRAFSIAW
jgi:hypothetical protein